MRSEETSNAPRSSVPEPSPSAARASEGSAVAPPKRGFGAMDRAEVRRLARKGGLAAHRAGTAHEFTSEEARAAGRKGGLATKGRQRETEPAEPETAIPTDETA
jgi:uncharacterized protein